MRKIKFRAWDSDQKKFEFLDIIHQHTIMTSLNIPSRGSWDKLTQFMQYTGLKDKNGVELYQKDIIKYISENDGETEFVSLIDADLTSGILINDSSLSLEFHLYEHGLGNGNFEIIGNIYEHPNLINQ